MFILAAISYIWAAEGLYQDKRFMLLPTSMNTMNSVDYREATFAFFSNELQKDMNEQWKGRIKPRYISKLVFGQVVHVYWTEIPGGISTVWIRVLIEGPSNGLRLVSDTIVPAQGKIEVAIKENILRVLAEGRTPGYSDGKISIFTLDLGNVVDW